VKNTKNTGQKAEDTESSGSNLRLLRKFFGCDVIDQTEERNPSHAGRRDGLGHYSGQIGRRIGQHFVLLDHNEQAATSREGRLYLGYQEKRPAAGQRVVAIVERREKTLTANTTTYKHNHTLIQHISLLQINHSNTTNDHTMRSALVFFALFGSGP